MAEQPIFKAPRRKRRRMRRVRMRRLIPLGLLAVALLVVGIYYTFRFPGDIDSVTYPLAYTEEIAQYADEYGLDPAHIAAVIYCESSFRPAVESYAGARGLMQIMPDTGQWIAEKLGETESYTVERLYEPALNIRYGCWFLQYLGERFGYDLTKQTAAYHAGGTRVSEWLKDTQYSPDGETLASIPYDSTRDYVRKVESAYEKYKELYAQ